MTAKTKILLVGIDPFLIDFTSPEFAAFPGLTAEKVEVGIKGSITELCNLGYEAELCWTDFGLTAINILEKCLKEKQPDGVLIGAGIRLPEKNFLLFEKMINSIHDYSPKSRIFFNSNPKDTIDSVKRWL